MDSCGFDCVCNFDLAGKQSEITREWNEIYVSEPS